MIVYEIIFITVSIKMKVNRKVKHVCNRCVSLDGNITTTVILPIITTIVLNANDRKIFVLNLKIQLLVISYLCLCTLFGLWKIQTVDFWKTCILDNSLLKCKCKSCL